VKSSPTTTTRLAASEAAELVAAVAALGAALANLDAAQSGYPTVSIGAAPSATHSDGEAEVSTSTERAALHPDAARTALRRIHEIVARLHDPVRELYGLTAQWSYATHTPKLVIADNDEWCDSCLRMHRCEPRYADRKWCWFCTAFRDEFGRLPSLELLERHHRGERITQQARRDDRAARREVRK
jgi:hypothetical protein